MRNLLGSRVRTKGVLLKMQKSVLSSSLNIARTFKSNHINFYEQYNTNFISAKDIIVRKKNVLLLFFFYYYFFFFFNFSSHLFYNFHIV